MNFKQVHIYAKNAKEYWKLLKSNYVKTDCKITMSQFEQYFKSINDPESVFFQPDEDVIYFNNVVQNEVQIMFNELNVPFTDNEIKIACNELNNDRSGGSDFVSNEMFKYGFDIIGKYIVTLFNKIFNLGYFPPAWTEGYIVPLFKNGDQNNPGNYRGITILSTFKY